MSRFRTDLHHLAGLPSDERLRALERIIPPSAVQAVLRQTGHDQRRCTRLPPSFVLLFVVGPVLTRLLGPDPAVLYTAALVYPTAIVAVAVVWWRRRAWRLSRGHAATAVPAGHPISGTAGWWTAVYRRDTAG